MSASRSLLECGASMQASLERLRSWYERSVEAALLARSGQSPPHGQVPEHDALGRKRSSSKRNRPSRLPAPEAPLEDKPPHRRPAAPALPSRVRPTSGAPAAAPAAPADGDVAAALCATAADADVAAVRRRAQGRPAPQPGPPGGALLASVAADLDAAGAAAEPGEEASAVRRGWSAWSAGELRRRGVGPFQWKDRGSPPLRAGEVTGDVAASLGARWPAPAPVSAAGGAVSEEEPASAAASVRGPATHGARSGGSHGGDATHDGAGASSSGSERPKGSARSKGSERTKGSARSKGTLGGRQGLAADGAESAGGGSTQRSAAAGTAPSGMASAAEHRGPPSSSWRRLDHTERFPGIGPPERVAGARAPSLNASAPAAARRMAATLERGRVPGMRSGEGSGAGAGSWAGRSGRAERQTAAGRSGWGDTRGAAFSATEALALERARRGPTPRRATDEDVDACGPHLPLLRGQGAMPAALNKTLLF